MNCSYSRLNEDQNKSGVAKAAQFMSILNCRGVIETKKFFGDHLCRRDSPQSLKICAPNDSDVVWGLLLRAMEGLGSI
jgi:hypothetical protein